MRPNVMYITVVSLIFAAYVGAYMTAEIIELRTLRHHADDWQVAMAQVSGEKSTWREGFLSYEYTVNGQAYTGLSRNCWNDVLMAQPCNGSTEMRLVGQQVPIRFNPADPKESVLESAVQEAVGMSFILRVLVAIALVACIPIGFILSRRKM